MSFTLRRTLGLLPAAAALGLLLAPVAAAPAQAAVAQPVDVVRVRFDPPGRDAANNAGWTQEFVELKNTSRQTVDLSGYTVSDNGGKHRFTAPKGTRLAPGRTVQLHSGQGRNSASALYWGTRGYVWNNTGDSVVLKTARGQLVEKCTYRGTEAGGTKTC